MDLVAFAASSGSKTTTAKVLTSDKDTSTANNAKSLTTKVTGSGTNDCSGTPTSFDDLAATSITAGSAPFAGSFSPEEPLSAFAGEDQEGGWILRIADTAAADTGTVGCVQLRIRSA